MLLETGPFSEDVGLFSEYTGLVSEYIGLFSECTGRFLEYMAELEEACDESQLAMHRLVWLIYSEYSEYLFFKKPYRSSKEPNIFSKEPYTF